MRLKQFTHLLLAVLFVAQSSAAMASALVMSYAPEQVNEVAVDTPEESTVSEAESGCHGQSTAEEIVASKNCCDSMEQQCCLLGCIAPVHAVPPSETVSVTQAHVRFVLARLVTHPDMRPTSLYRPPRII